VHNDVSIKDDEATEKQSTTDGKDKLKSLAPEEQLQVGWEGRGGGLQDRHDSFCVQRMVPVHAMNVTNCVQTCDETLSSCMTSLTRCTIICSSDVPERCLQPSIQGERQTS
jgi:hypothetical protein